MGNLFALLISFLFAALIAFFWVRGIDKMKREHPDYKGEDFVDWDEESTNKDSKEK